jgi:preprotein translocase subunit SecD
MLQLSRWKVVLVVLATVLSLVWAAPNVLPASVRQTLPSWMAQTLNLGLDLQGGSYLLLEVDTAALTRERMANLVEDIRTNFRSKQIPFVELAARGTQVTVRVAEPARVEAAYQELLKLAPPSAQTGQPDFNVVRQNDRLLMTFTEPALAQQSRDAVRQSIEIIRRRVDQLGTREPSITQQGANRVVVQAPGEADPERLNRVIGQTAKLTFHMVDETTSAAEAAQGLVPPGSQLLTSEEPAEPQVLVRRRALVTGEMLQEARADFDQQGRPVVTFRFNGEGARRFGDATANNVGRRFAIVLDEKVISAPVINEPILGGSGQISGNFTVESANELALLLRSGALPAPLNMEEQRTVGAELGQDAVDAGLISTAIAFVLVLAFMVLAYGLLFGGISIVALIVNGLMIIAAMSLIQATLTLPGIAGLILTLAVAVDANVLIYERMREEARLGRSPIMAMESGFSRAMLTILDANLTTLVAALIMFFFGAGPVRGFAWTLTIGVFTSVFTAVMITQVLLAWWYRAARPKKLPIV